MLPRPPPPKVFARPFGVKRSLSCLASSLTCDFNMIKNYTHDWLLLVAALSRLLTDIDLIWEAHRPEEAHLAALLTSTCGGKRRQRSRGCIGTYGSHNPPLVWFDFHNVSTPADLVTTQGGTHSVLGSVSSRCPNCCGTSCCGSVRVPNWLCRAQRRTGTI